MKTTLWTAALALSLAGTAAFAQAVPTTPQQDQPQRHEQRHAPNPHKAALRISRELNLPPDQAAKLEPILAERQQKVMALRADTSLTEEQRRKQMHTIQAATRLQMANVLSPDQMKQLKTMRHKHIQDTPQGV